ncbi:MAG: hypothetical protein NTY53_14585 [Kiritimatiellaeota bacterium]|nr:hypothetical protein [Kiritimatiellota bacterium]
MTGTVGICRLDGNRFLPYPSPMSTDIQDRKLNAAEDQALRVLVTTHRARCLWFLKPDFFPATLPAALRVLDAIEQHGDLAAFRETRRLRVWLSPASSAMSAVS